MRKIVDEVHHFRGMWDRTARGVCWVRVFVAEGSRPVLVISEMPDNPSSSVTNMIELLAPELIRQHLPERFENLPPVPIFEHYPTKFTLQGKTAREATWSRVVFNSWAPRRVRFSDQERIAFGAPKWEHVAEEAMIAILGEDEVRARPPRIARVGDAS